MLEQRLFFGVTMKKIILSLLLSFCALANASTDVIKIIVPFAPGGAGDAFSRQIQKDLGQALNQPVVLEFKLGAGGEVAAAYLASLPANETAYMLHGSGIINSLLLNKSLPFTEDQIRPLVGVGYLPFVMLTSNKSGIRTFQDLQKMSIDQRLTFGSSGNLSSTHLAGEVFKSATGKNFVHVPYKGNNQALTDLIAGNIDCIFFLYTNSIQQHIESKKINAVAIGFNKRLTELPDVPTFNELGLPTINQLSWSAIFTNANGNVEEQNRVRDALIKILKSNPQPYQELGWIVPRDPSFPKNFYDIEKTKIRNIIKNVSID